MLKRLLARFITRKEGTTAVEFAMIAMPFFALLFGVIETALVFFASATLENGVHEAARLVRTGQLQINGGGLSQFRQTVCDNAPILSDCVNSLYVDVRKFQDFTSINVSNPIQNGQLQNNFQFTPGVGEDVILVRVFYVWDVNAPFIGTFLANMNDGQRLLSAAAAFRNEPF